MGRRVHPLKRSVSWVNSVLRQFLANGPKNLAAALDAPANGLPAHDQAN